MILIEVGGVSLGPVAFSLQRFARSFAASYLVINPAARS